MKSGSFPPFFFVGRVRDRDNRNEIGDDFPFLNLKKNKVSLGNETKTKRTKNKTWEK